MSSEFVEKHVNEIMEDSSLEFPKNMAFASAWILGNLKGINLKILNVGETSSLSDYYVLASASNINQASSMADTITSQMKKRGYSVVSKEGFHPESDWLLIDLGDVIVHIFLDHSRDVYNLDNLWEDAITVEIPSSYYSSDEEALTLGSTSEKEYF